MLHIYTDGSCNQAGESTGPGGWATVIISTGNVIENTIVGGEEVTTNNRMEMTAFLTALERVAEDVLNDIPGPFYIYSDSAYIVNCLKQKWYQRWQINGWRTAKRETVKNKELWEKIIALYSYFERHFVGLKVIKVKGHSDNEGNNIADRLAVEERKKYE